MDIVNDLLNLPDFEPTEAVPSLPVTGCVYADVAENSGVCSAQGVWLVDMVAAVALRKESVELSVFFQRCV